MNLKYFSSSSDPFYTLERELIFKFGMHSHAGAWERENLSPSRHAGEQGELRSKRAQPGLGSFLSLSKGVFGG